MWLLSKEIGQLRLAIASSLAQRAVPNSVELLQRELSDSEQDLVVAKADLEKERARPVAERPRTFEEKVHDPEFQANLRRSVSFAVNSRYSELFSSLNLEPKRLQRLRDILSERTLGTGEDVPSLNSSNPDIMPPPDTDKFRAAIDNELRSVLHREEYDVYRAHEATLPAHNLVDQIQSALGSAATPMTTGQAADIIAIALTKSSGKQQNQIDTVGNRVADVTGASTANISDEMMRRAGAILTKEQLDVLADMREQQDAQTALDQLVQHIESAPD